MIGVDKAEMQRFHAAADVVLKSEKVRKETKANNGRVNASKACTIQ